MNIFLHSFFVVSLQLQLSYIFVKVFLNWFYEWIGNIGESATVADLHVQHDILKECVEQLKAAESSRTTLLSHLREALHDQVGQLMDLIS